MKVAKAMRGMARPIFTASFSRLATALVQVSPKLNDDCNVHWLFLACLPNSGSTAFAKLLSGARAATTLTPSGEGQWLVPAMAADGTRWQPDHLIDYNHVRNVWLTRVALRRKPFVVVEKSPPNLCRFAPLVAAFSTMPVTTVAMSRNPYAICSSWARRYSGATIVQTWEPALDGQIETNPIRFYEAIGEICGRRCAMLARIAPTATIATSYEDVTAQPHAFLRQLALAEPLLDNVDPARDIAVKDYPTQGLQNMNDRDIARLSPEHRAAVTRGLRPYADAIGRLGYDLDAA